MDNLAFASLMFVMSSSTFVIARKQLGNQRNRMYVISLSMLLVALSLAIFGSTSLITGATAVVLIAASVATFLYSR